MRLLSEVREVDENAERLAIALGECRCESCRYAAIEDGNDTDFAVCTNLLCVAQCGPRQGAVIDGRPFYYCSSERSESLVCGKRGKLWTPV